MELRLCTAQVLAHTNVTGVMLETEGSLGEFEFFLLKAECPGHSLDKLNQWSSLHFAK